MTRVKTWEKILEKGTTYEVSPVMHCFSLWGSYQFINSAELNAADQSRKISLRDWETELSFQQSHKGGDTKLWIKVYEGKGPLDFQLGPHRICALGLRLKKKITSIQKRLVHLQNNCIPAWIWMTYPILNACKKAKVNSIWKKIALARASNYLYNFSYTILLYQAD